MTATQTTTDQLGTRPRTDGPARLVNYLTTPGRAAAPGPLPLPPLIGVIEGTGVGPEVLGAALRVLDAVEQALALKCEIQHSAAAGPRARFERDQLPEEMTAFCGEIFGRGGAILNGPYGGRYVYNLRRQFDLFCKFVPVQPSPALARVGRINPEFLREVDILIVRENAGGVYQGRWGERTTGQGRLAEHAFAYSEAEVRRIVEVAARAAANRRGGLRVVVKDGGIPGITALWRDVGQSAARAQGVEAAFVNIDLAAYELIQNPGRFDVVVAPNLFGDVLADIAGALVGSRGVTFSGNFDPQGRGVYQTNHGCAADLAGRDVANPGGQLLALAMMLRESFGMFEPARLIERALEAVWRAGLRTVDVAEPGCTVLGTQALAGRVAEEVFRLAEARPMT